METSIYDSKLYKRSRIAYVTQCGVAYLVHLLLDDSFLAKLLRNVGLDDATIGVIASLASFAFLTQLFIIPIMGRFTSYKRFVVITNGAGIVLSFFVYLLPFMNLSLTVTKLLAFFFVAGGAMLQYVSDSMYYRWANSFVNPGKLASFGSFKEITSLGAGIAVTMGAGVFVDVMEKRGQIRFAFLVLALYIFLSAVINIVTLLLIGDRQFEKPMKQTDGKTIFALLMRNKSFMRIVLSGSLEYIAMRITIGFLGTYKTQELGFSVWQVQLISSFAYLVRMFVSLPFGHYADRKGFMHGYILGQKIMLAAFVVLIFTHPSTRLLILVFMVILNVAYASCEQQRSTMVYDYVPSEYFSHALAFKTGITATAGFLASLLGGGILSFAQKVTASSGGHIYGQQLLAVISCFVLLINIVYIKTHILNQSKDRE